MDLLSLQISHTRPWGEEKRTNATQHHPVGLMTLFLEYVSPGHVSALLSYGTTWGNKRCEIMEHLPFGILGRHVEP